MDLARAFLLAGCLLVVICTEVKQNATELLEGETKLEAKERVRRLIPYMTYYLDQGQSQDPYLTQQFQPSAYYSPVPQPQPQQLVPVGYLVGGGYNTVPVYSAPVQREQDFYTPQQPSDLAHMIAQNYLAIAKQMDSQKKTQHQTHYAAKEPEPVQYTNSQKETEYRTRPQQTIQYVTKQQYTNENTPINQVYKVQSPTKSYTQPRQRPRPKQTNRRPVYYENNPLPQYISQDSPYIPIQNSYEPSYDSTPKNNKYKPDPDVLTITKSQEIILPATYPESIALLPVKTTPKPKVDYEEFLPTVPTIQKNSVLDLVAGYQQTKALPDKFTTTNIGDSIQTLSSILKLLQKAKSKPIINLNDGDGSFDNGVSQNYSPYQTEGSTPGQAGIDYPAYAEIPETDFNCKSQRYKGFFGDPETNCQVWHYCDLNGGQASFLCPNGTIFSQVALTCDWWFNVKCASTAQLYVLNERLYKYILPHKPSFPEDYAGPLVDEYLTLKFQEAEAKRRNSTTTERPANTLQVLLSDEINQAVK